MIWVVWRQHRVQVLTAVGFLAVLGTYMLVSGGDAAPVLGWLPMMPVLVGIFWGAPLLAREVERGTHRLAWTQSVTRQHWLVAKLGWLGLAVTVAGLVLGLMVSAWLADNGVDRFGRLEFFSGSGVAAGAWWLFAFALGVASGALLRRLLPALALTIVVFFAVLMVMSQARDLYAEPLRTESEAVVGSGAMISGAGWVGPSGEEVDEPPVCANESSETYLDCVADAGYYSVYYYHPDDRYWRFQWTEVAVLLLGAVLLAGPVVFRVLRRPV